MSTPIQFSACRIEIGLPNVSGLPGLLSGGRVGHLGEDVVPEVVPDQLRVLHVHLVHDQVRHLKVIKTLVTAHENVYQMSI